MRLKNYGVLHIAVFCFCALNVVFLCIFGGFNIVPFQTGSLEMEVEKSQRTNVKKMMYVNPRPDVKVSHTFDKCEYSACAMTQSVMEADVLFFNAARMRDFSLPPRRANQIWLMFSREPPDLPSFDNLDREDLKNQVNFSRMVLGDSTWQNKYGHLWRRPLPHKDYKHLFQQKKYDVAWFVSQCDRPSRRMEYVQRMMRVVNVHIYGRCGNYTCGQKGYEMGDKKKQCLGLLTKHYKFYLSFENTFCRDYVSEKFFNIFEEVDTIPVVRGGADYKRLFPPSVFIDSSDFPSPESLGKHLHRLARNQEKYISILKEKNRYTMSGAHTNFECDLCKTAHTGQPQHIYTDFYRWVRAPGNCWSPRDLS